MAEQNVSLGWGHVSYVTPPAEADMVLTEYTGHRAYVTNALQATLWLTKFSNRIASEIFTYLFSPDGAPQKKRAKWVT